MNPATYAYALFWFLAAPSFAQEVEAHYLRAYDGDTIFVDLPKLMEMDPDKAFAIFWSGISIRISGIDCPEIKGKCAREVELAHKAKQLVHETLSSADQVVIRNIKKDKYFRLLGEVFADDMQVAEILLNANLAIPYKEGRKKSPWCLEETS